jgi:aromatic ring hydroxylase
MAARLFDALHDDKRKHKLLLPTDTGNGGMTHAFFKAPKTVEDLVAGRDAIAKWARMTYGWMGRSPDYKAAFLATLGANVDFTIPTRKTPGAGTSSAKSACHSSITPSFIHRSIGTDRRTRSATSAAMGSPFDYPLSSRLDENDAIFIMDKVLVPWENVFRLRRHGEGEQLLPAHRVPSPFRRARLHAARRQARFHLGFAAQGHRSRGHQGLSRRTGERW